MSTYFFHKNIRKFYIYTLVSSSSDPINFFDVTIFWANKDIKGQQESLLANV